MGIGLIGFEGFQVTERVLIVVDEAVTLRYKPPYASTKYIRGLSWLLVVVVKMGNLLRFPSRLIRTSYTPRGYRYGSR